MAKEIAASTMKLKLVSGQDAKDNPKYSTRSFKDINTELSVGTDMAGLQTMPLGQVLRTDTKELDA